MTTPFDRAVLPPDLKAQPFLWQRRPADSWSEKELRAPVLVFLNAFVDVNSWAAEWSVTERFAKEGRASIVEWKRRTGVSLIENERDFKKQRGATPILLLRVKRTNGTVYEISLPFADANDTSTATLQQLISMARKHFEQRNRDE